MADANRKSCSAFAIRIYSVKYRKIECIACKCTLNSLRTVKKSLPGIFVDSP